MLFFFIGALVPLCIVDLVLRMESVRPPGWFHDSLVLVSLSASLLIFRRAWSEHRLRRSRKAAADSEWEATLPCLVHDIRNYSSIIKGNVQLLRARIGGGVALEPLARLERTTGKIEDLAAELLEAATFTRVVHPEPLCLRALVGDCMADHFHESRDAFHIESDANLPGLVGDARKLDRVFLNLFRNAREAGAQSIRIRLSSAAGRLRVLVEDDGPGCAPEAMARLFQPLFTTKKANGGTGLGLYLVKAIMEAHDGAVWAVCKNSWAEKGTGMIFCLDFPVGAGRGAARMNPAKRTKPDGWEVFLEGKTS